MAWATLTEDHLAGLLRFLGPREAYCTAFTEKLLDGGRATVPGPGVRVHVHLTQTGEVDGAILQGRSGLFYPVLSESISRIDNVAVELIRKYSRRLYSVMGRASDVSTLEAAFRTAPSQAVDYHLMAQDSPPPEIPLPRLPEGFEIRRSNLSDAARLARIQKEYEIEEVLLPGNFFDAAASLQHLKRALASQIIIHGTVGDQPVAKAGTNARGMFFDQIGGVYTEPALRSRGVGTALMLRLLSIIAGESKTATLFVKMDNGPALHMYQTIGFRVLDEFRISYYR